MTDPLAPKETPLTEPLSPTGLRPVPRSGPRPDQEAYLVRTALVVESFGLGLAMSFVGGLFVYAGSNTREMMEAAGQQWPFLLYLAFSAGWCWPMAALHMFKTAPDRRTLAALVGVSCTGAVASVLLWRGPEILLWSLPCLGAALLPWLVGWICSRPRFASTPFVRSFTEEIPDQPLSAAAVMEILLSAAIGLAGVMLLLHSSVFFIPLVRAKTGVIGQVSGWGFVDIFVYLNAVNASLRDRFAPSQAFACALILLGLSLALGPIEAFRIPEYQKQFWWFFWVPLSFVFAALLYRSLKRKGRDTPGQDAPNAGTRPARALRTARPRAGTPRRKRRRPATRRKSHDRPAVSSTPSPIGKA